MRLKFYSTWEKSRNEGFLEQNPDAKVIDLGCGDGRFTEDVKKKIRTYEIYGVDIHSPSLKKAKKEGLVL